MATIRTRLEWLERNGRAGCNDDRRALVEAVNRALGDAEFMALVNDLQNAVCRADSDPSLPCQRGLAIPDGPSIEECERRLATWLLTKADDSKVED